MAEEGCSGTWWNSWIQTAKEKSAEALDFVKKDLTEFTSTMQTDSKKAVENVKENINQDNVTSATQKARQGVTSFLGGITKVLTIEPEDKPRPGSKQKSSSQPIFSRAKARLNAIQVDEGTYVNEPAGPPEEYEAWCKQFELDSHKGEISELLVVNVEVRSLYTQLVPSVVSHADFWRRYFYKLHQLDMDEARREALKKRAEESTATLTWDDSDDDSDWVDMSGPSSPPSERSDQNKLASEKSAPRAEEKRVPDMHSVPDGEFKQQTNKSQTQEDVFEVIQDNVMDRGSDSNDVSKSGSDIESTKSDTKTVQDENKTKVHVDENLPERTSEMNAHNSTKDSEKQLESSTDTLTGVTSSFKDSTSVSEISESRDSSSTSLEVIKSDEVASPEVAPSEVSVVAAESTEQAHTEEAAIKTHMKGDLVVVGSSSGSDRTSPSSANSEQKETDEDDWEREFDIDVTEEDLKLAQQTLAAAKVDDTAEEKDEDDWEDWE